MPESQVVGADVLSFQPYIIFHYIILCYIYIYIIGMLEGYRDNGKENRNYDNGVIQDLGFRLWGVILNPRSIPR